MDGQTMIETKKVFYCQYLLADGEHSALLDADRMEWDDDKGFLRVYNAEALVGVYDLGKVLAAHIRERGK